MKIHRVPSRMVITLALIFVVTAQPLYAGQNTLDPLTQEEILRELRALRSRVQRLEEDNERLRRQIGQPQEREISRPVEPVVEPSEPAPVVVEAQPAAEPVPEEREPAPLTAGYDRNAVNGFFIRDQHDEFRLNIGAYTQARYSMNWRNGTPRGKDSFNREAAMNRTRIFLEGKFTDAFNYHFRTNIDDTGNFDLIAAYLTYNLDQNWSFRLGEQYLALSREDWMYAQDVLGMEFSPNDFTFALGSSIGAQAHYQGDNHRYWFGISNGRFGGAKTEGLSNQADVMFNARYEYQIGDDWSVWDDLVGRRGRSRGILLGLAGAYQYDDKDDGIAPNNATELIADISFNGDGYQAMLAGTWLWADPKDGGKFNNYGLLAQGGYFFTDRFQVYGRYDLISPGNKDGNFDTFNAVALGVNYFPFTRTNRWKFTGELGYLFEALDKTIVAPSDSLNWLEASKSGQTSLRFQAQFGF